MAAAVRKAAAVVPVAIASGREPADVARYARELGLTTPQISDNGARLLDPSTNTTIEAHLIAPEDALRITTALENNSEMRFFAVDGWHMVRRVADIDRWEITVIATSTADRNAAPQRQERAVRDAMALAPDGVSTILSLGHDGERWYLNYTRRGIDKGSGLRSWAERLGVSLGGVVFVGDSLNDIEAFDVAGLPVAMGGASDDVRAAARESVGDVDSDGVAEAIERFVLAPMGRSF
ncbi:MAG: HAD family phosphatase [Chloroflexi bacterium]|nr:HAD family phosphatase [Chloroflexota bacterium]